MYYDNGNFPFSKRIFDWVVLFSVLHHSDKQEKLLREAGRIAKKGIIVHEDLLIKKKMHDTYTKVHDFLANRRKGIPCPLTFRTVDEWHEIFDKHDLNVIYEKVYKKKKFFFNTWKGFWVLKHK